jgi:hypothetical protein
MSNTNTGNLSGLMAGSLGISNSQHSGRLIPDLKRRRRHMFSSRAQERPNMYIQHRGNIRSNPLVSEGGADKSQSATKRRASHTERGGPVRVGTPEASKSHDIDMGLAVSTGSDTDSEPPATKKRFVPPRQVSTRSSQAQIRGARHVGPKRTVRTQVVAHPPPADVPMLETCDVHRAHTYFSALLQQNRRNVSTGCDKNQGSAVPAMVVFGSSPAVSDTTPGPVTKANIGRKRFQCPTQRAAASAANSKNPRAFDAIVDEMTRMDLGE